ncbi:HAD family hydrolase [Streptomyces physcomitrii]|uniref:HAD-IB family hydrolase n=1 Tax=Streptomyces physcomitrii TaxID=2724184 RepID=A0ABX1GWU4_9ACTN|nr:HAD-IB family hydrolase [Streptomyces physcomitrii]NKI40580.1 HAD-IB family hydrolase [Streptomyces physcomitrii]
MAPAARAAFFDVDDTLVRVKTMFSFLAFHYRYRGEPDLVYERARDRLKSLHREGHTRADVNRVYYRLYQGAGHRALAEEGRLWFRESERSGDFFHGPAVAALREHLAAGDLVVLVSGSFYAPLDPIAAALGAHVALGTEPLTEDGRLTGEVVEPMIGAGKGRAARRLAEERGLDLAECWAYGDHASDLELLTSVGHPVAVGDDPVLTARATEHRHWGRLPGIELPSAV